MGPVISESQMKSILGYIEQGKREGAPVPPIFAAKSGGFAQ
jgi:acyl-CoA reductase-like NAD-dependent aldehyde dehydrogenase